MAIAVRLEHTHIGNGKLEVKPHEASVGKARSQRKMIPSKGLVCRHNRRKPNSQHINWAEQQQQQ